MNKIIFVLAFFLTLTVGQTFAQEKWALIQDLNEDWLYYDEEWLPVTDRFDNYNAIYFKLNVVSAESHLMIKYPGEFSVFVNKKIYYSATDSLMINIDSLLVKEDVSEPLLAVYAPEVQPARLRTQLYIKYNPEEEPEITEVINVVRRESASYENLAVAAFLFLLVLLVLLKNFYPRNLSTFYDVRKLFSSRDTDEDFLRGRLFSQVNILIMIFQCLVIGLLISILLIYLGASFRSGNNNFPDYMIFWLRCSLYTAGFLLLKFILIRNFTSLYNIYQFSTPHFMSYLRMLTIIMGLGLLVLYIGIFALGWQNSITFETYLNTILLMLGIGIIFIYFKLLNSASYKNLHLFSYLCATEILPYVVILKVSINQSI